MTTDNAANDLASLAYSRGSPRKTFVVGLGNLLLKDEGIGVHVVQRIQQMGLPIEAIDIGTAGLDIVDLMIAAERLIIIDAALMGREAGSVVRFDLEEANFLSTQRSFSLHEAGFAAIIELAEALGIKPKVTVIGIQPKEVDWGTDLSPELEAKIAEIIDLVLKELGLEEVRLRA